MNKICCCCGWCSFTEIRTDTKASPIQYKANYLNDFWKPQIEKYFIPDEYFVYLSNCDIDPTPYFTENIVRGHEYAKGLQHRYDWFNSILMGAQYSYGNGMDMVVIEQDCMVHRLDKALEWAQGKKIVYGYGTNASLYGGWAENSFMYISNDFLTEFIKRLLKNKFHEQHDIKDNIPEIIWQRLFGDIAEYWPWGVGRKRPIPFGSEIFFAQQLQMEEINQFMNKT